MNKKILITAAVTGFLAVILGAFAAHGLKEKLNPESLDSFQTGSRYMMYHALLMLWLGSSSALSKSRKRKVFVLVLTGLVLFSGSIFLLTTAPIWGTDLKSIGFITPIGGTLLIISWLLLGYYFIRSGSAEMPPN